MACVSDHPAVKWGAAMAAIAIGGGLVYFTIRGTFFPSTGLPAGEQQRVVLTCTNPDCPGRTRETAPIDSPPNVLGPHKFTAMIRGDFCDWPMQCPECGQKSVYLKTSTLHGTLTIHRLCDPSVRCPDCGEVTVIDSLSTPSTIVCPKCGRKMGG